MKLVNYDRVFSQAIHWKQLTNTRFHFEEALLRFEKQILKSERKFNVV